MACQDRDIPGDIKPHLNVGLVSDSSHSDIIADTKEEIEEHGFLTSIKAEHVTFASDTKTFQSAVVKLENDEYSQFESKYNKEEQHMLWEEGTSRNRNTVNNQQVEQGTFSSDTVTAVIKTEDDDEFSEFETKYNRKRQYMTWEEGTNCNRNTKNNHTVDDVADPRSTCELYEEVQFGVIKMEEDRDTRSELTEDEDRGSSDQNSVHKIRRVNHVRIHGEELKKTFDCIPCKRSFSRQDNLDNHILTQHSNNGEMMNRVTSTIHRCKQCRYIAVERNDIVKHMRTHGEIHEGILYCIKCEREFSSKVSLDRHIVAQHNNDDEMMKSVTSKIHRCNHCSYITVQTSYFSRHLRTHGERPGKTFGCIKCEREFSSKVSLDRHIVKQHSDDGEMMNSVTSKIHRCDHCNYVTVQTNYFNRHLRTHEDRSIDI